MMLSEYEMLSDLLDEHYMQYCIAIKYTGEYKEELQPALISHMYTYNEQIKDLLLNLTKLS
jgi:hypothetical protein